MYTRKFVIRIQESVYFTVLINSLFLDDKKIFHGNDFHHLSDENFQQFAPRCDEQDFQSITIRPSDGCPDIFRIRMTDKNTEIYIRQDETIGKEYCLMVNEDLTYEARYCKQVKSDNRDL